MKKLQLFMLFSMILLSVVLYPSLPDVMPTHWGIDGHINGYMPKIVAVIMLPFLTLAMYSLFQVLPSLDPNKKKYHLFQNEWNIIQTTLIGFFLYIEAVMYYLSYNPKTSILSFMFFGLGVLFTLMGNYLSKIRQNYFIGVKTPWTLASEENWNKTHRVASKSFVIVGVIMLLEAVFPIYPAVVTFGAIILASVVPVGYSYLLYKKSEK